MWRLRTTLLSVAVVSALTVWACGPDFRSVLANRHGTLQAPIGNSFNDEMQQLAPHPLPKLPLAVTMDEVKLPPLREADRQTLLAERQGLTPSQVSEWMKMRQAATVAAAASLGKSLPPAVRLYTLGAIAYHQQPMTDAIRAQAVQYFLQVLQLPKPEARSRMVWAQFMLGKMAVEADQIEVAVKHFQQTRLLVQQGMPDPLGLGIASLGEEARLSLVRSQYAPAIRLYATQAAYGDPSGTASLKQIANQLLAKPELLAGALQIPEVQQLLAVYVLNLSADRLREEQLFNAEKFDFSDLRQKNSPLTILLAAVEKQGLANFRYADKLAAVAYNRGQFALAERLAAKSDTGMAAWVKAKLAMRAGKSDEAGAQYAKAVHAFPASFEKNTFGSVMQIQAEQGVFSLSRGEYTQALAQLYRVGKVHWLDLAYVAERVVTVDELKAFVDANVPVPPLPKTTKAEDGTIYADADPGTEWPASNVNAQLRDLLARRMVREGLFEEAANYFHQVGDYRFADQAVHEHVSAYAEALSQAKSAWTRKGRAEGLFAAAVLARQHGMDMMGYELFPDQFSSGGNFFWLHENNPIKDQPVTSDEVKHFQQTAAKQSQPFHYRYIAVDLAKQAANELPPRSQAYAAILCRATGWMNRDPAAAAVLYQTYVQHGAHVPWASHFGKDCPAPEFDRADGMIRMQYWQTAKHWVRHYQWGIIGSSIALLGLASGLWWRRRRPSAG